MTAPSTLRRGLDFVTVSRDLLAFLVEIFEDNAQPLPNRRYLAPGLGSVIALDCEQVAITFDMLSNGAATSGNPLTVHKGRTGMAAQFRNAQLSIALTRCTPNPESTKQPFPSPERIDDAGGMFFRDMGIMSKALTTWIAQRAPENANAELDTVQATGPDGGYHGVLATMYLSAHAVL